MTYVLLSSVILNGYTYHKGTVVEVAEIRDDVALVVAPGCYFFELGMQYLIKMPELSPGPLKRKSKVRPIIHKRK